MNLVGKMRGRYRAKASAGYSVNQATVQEQRGPGTKSGRCRVDPPSAHDAADGHMFRALLCEGSGRVRLLSAEYLPRS